MNARKQSARLFIVGFVLLAPQKNHAGFHNAALGFWPGAVITGKIGDNDVVLRNHQAWVKLAGQPVNGNRSAITSLQFTLNPESEVVTGTPYPSAPTFPDIVFYPAMGSQPSKVDTGVPLVDSTPILLEFDNIQAFIQAMNSHEQEDKPVNETEIHYRTSLTSPTTLPAEQNQTMKKKMIEVYQKDPRVQPHAYWSTLNGDLNITVEYENRSRIVITPSPTTRQGQVQTATFVYQASNIGEGSTGTTAGSTSSEPQSSTGSTADSSASSGSSSQPGATPAASADTENNDKTRKDRLFSDLLSLIRSCCRKDQQDAKDVENLESILLQASPEHLQEWFNEPATFLGKIAIFKINLFVLEGWPKGLETLLRVASEKDIKIEQEALDTALGTACVRTDMEAVEVLLNHGANADTTLCHDPYVDPVSMEKSYTYSYCRKEGLTALYRMARKHHGDGSYDRDADIVKKLLERGANPNAVINYRSLLFECLKLERFDMARQLLDSGKIEKGPEHHQHLVYAVERSTGTLYKGNYVEIRDRLINEGAAITREVYEACLKCKDFTLLQSVFERRRSLPKGERAELPILVAVDRKHLEWVERFLDEEPELINKRDEQGASLLGIACKQGFAEVVKCLLERGADTTLCKEDKPGDGVYWHGGTAMHGAAMAWRSAPLFLLLKHGCLYRQNHRGETPLHWITRFGECFTAVPYLLLATGCDPSVKNNDGKTAADCETDPKFKLDDEIEQKRRDTLLSVLKNQKLRSSLIRLMNNPRDYKRIYEQCPALHSVLTWNKSTKVDDSTKVLNELKLNDFALLHIAVLLNNPQAVLQLLEAGCELSPVNRFKETPLELALILDRDSIVKLFVAEYHSIIRNGKLAERGVSEEEQEFLSGCVITGVMPLQELAVIAALRIRDLDYTTLPHLFHRLLEERYRINTNLTE